jgi:hypothetical protein
MPSEPPPPPPIVSIVLDELQSPGTVQVVPDTINTVVTVMVGSGFYVPHRLSIDSPEQAG